MRRGTVGGVSLSGTKSSLEQRRELEADLVCVCGGEVGTGIGEVSSNQLEETELPTPSGSQLDSLW